MSAATRRRRALRASTTGQETPVPLEHESEEPDFSGIELEPTDVIPPMARSCVLLAEGEPNLDGQALLDWYCETFSAPPLTEERARFHKARGETDTDGWRRWKQWQKQYAPSSRAARDA
jgi:hypothetical protein